tara:strand:- start:43 stop:864 length:822 start_codon:yes stop_codon:yes gene_type:complete
MLVIISLKKLTPQQKVEIRKYYSLIQFNEQNHKFKDISGLGNCDLLWFSIIPSITGNINKNNVFKYLLNHIEELVNPKVVIVYDRQKYRKLLKGLEKVVNFVIPNFPQLKHKNLEEILEKSNKKEEKTEEKKEVKNLLLDSPTEDDEDSDVDFDEIHVLFTNLQNKYKKLKIFHKKEQNKNDKLHDEIDSLKLEIENLRQQVSSLKKDLEEKTLTPPVLKRELTSTDEISIIDENNSLVVKSSLSGLLETVSYRSRRDKKQKLNNLRKKYHTK